MKITTKRMLIYIVGMFTLTFGLILNTKCSLGTGAVVAVGVAGSSITGWTIGDVTLIEYIVFILIEMGIHIYKKKDKKVLIMDALQFPFSIFFSRFMNLFSNWIPSFATFHLAVRLFLLIWAYVFTALGVVIMLAMELIPNPTDGVVHTISEAFHIEMGLVKNLFDVCCFITAVLLCVLTNHPITGVGIGTIFSILMIGRFITLFNRLLKKKLVDFVK